MISALLNKKIEIEHGVHSTNAAGTPIFTWETFHEPYANVVNTSKSTRYEDGELLTFTTEFTVRYNSKTSLVNNKYRIKYNDDYYKIIQIVELEYRKTLKFITIAFEDDE